MARLGPHLVFDGFGCAPAPLEDLESLYGLLDGLPDRIHAQRAAPPQVVRHGLPGLDAGLSGLVRITHGHVSVHTFPRRRFVTVDVCAGGDIDVEDALRELGAAFRPRRFEWKLLDHGAGIPRRPGDDPRRVHEDRRAVVSRVIRPGVSR